MGKFLQAMVTRFASISTRKLSHALKLLTFNKTMVAISDYDDFYKTIKRHILSNVLGANAQVLIISQISFCVRCRAWYVLSHFNIFFFMN